MQLGGIIPPDFKMDRRAMAVRRAVYWHESRQSDQRTEQRGEDQPACLQPAHC